MRQSSEMKFKTDPDSNSKTEFKFLSTLESFSPIRLKVPQICKVFIRIFM